MTLHQTTRCFIKQDLGPKQDKEHGSSKIEMKNNIRNRLFILKSTRPDTTTCFIKHKMKWSAITSSVLSHPERNKIEQILQKMLSTSKMKTRQTTAAACCSTSKAHEEGDLIVCHVAAAIDGSCSCQRKVKR